MPKHSLKISFPNRHFFYHLSTSTDGIQVLSHGRWLPNHASQPPSCNPHLGNYSVWFNQRNVVQTWKTLHWRPWKILNIWTVGHIDYILRLFDKLWGYYDVTGKVPFPHLWLAEAQKKTIYKLHWLIGLAIKEGAAVNHVVVYLFKRVQLI